MQFHHVPKKHGRDGHVVCVRDFDPMIETQVSFQDFGADHLSGRLDGRFVRSRPGRKVLTFTIEKKTTVSS